eukprot:ctg_768.g269
MPFASWWSTLRGDGAEGCAEAESGDATSAASGKGATADAFAAEDVLDPQRGFLSHLTASERALLERMLKDTAVMWSEPDDALRETPEASEAGPAEADSRASSTDEPRAASLSSRLSSSRLSRWRFRGQLSTGASPPSSVSVPPWETWRHHALAPVAPGVRHAAGCGDRRPRQLSLLPPAGVLESFRAPAHLRQDGAFRCSTRVSERFLSRGRGLHGTPDLRHARGATGDASSGHRAAATALQRARHRGVRSRRRLLAVPQRRRAVPGGHDIAGAASVSGAAGQGAKTRAKVHWVRGDAAAVAAVFRADFELQHLPRFLGGEVDWQAPSPPPVTEGKGGA